MDFVNQAIAQFTELFRSMSPAGRITAILLLAAVVGSLALLVNTGVSSHDGFLLSGHSFSPEELAKAEAAFGSAGLSDYSVEGTKIRVPKNQQAAYLAALADNGAMPPNYGDLMLDAMNSGGPLASREDQRLRIQIAKQNEIARIISNMRGIAKAAVFYDTTPKSLFNRDGSVTASVSIQALDPTSLDDGRVRAIRHLVAGAIAGLSPEHVTVTDSSGRTWTSSGTDGVGSAMDDPYLTRKREYQKEYENKVLAVLSYVPGLTVGVDVELDREIERTQETIKVDPKAVALQTSEDTTSSISEAAGPGGRPGMTAQQPNAGAQLSGGNARIAVNTDETSKSQQTLAAGHDTLHSRTTGLTPKKVALAVGIPSGYLAQIWTERNPPVAGQAPAAADATALAKIRDEVTADIRSHLMAFVVSPSPEVDPKSLITVTTFQQVAPAPIAAPSIAADAMTWFGQYWSTLGMLGLGLFALTMLRSITRSIPAPAATTPAGAPPLPGSAAASLASASAASDEPTEPATPRAARLARRREGGTSLREELGEIVKEDPAAAANILQSWITSAT